MLLPPVRKKKDVDRSAAQSLVSAVNHRTFAEAYLSGWEHPNVLVPNPGELMDRARTLLPNLLAGPSEEDVKEADEILAGVVRCAGDFELMPSSHTPLLRLTRFTLDHLK